MSFQSTSSKGKNTGNETIVIKDNSTRIEDDLSTNDNTITAALKRRVWDLNTENMELREANRAHVRDRLNQNRLLAEQGLYHLAQNDRKNNTRARTIQSTIQSYEHLVATLTMHGFDKGIISSSTKDYTRSGVEDSDSSLSGLSLEDNVQLEGKLIQLESLISQLMINGVGLRTSLPVILEPLDGLFAGWSVVAGYWT